MSQETNKPSGDLKPGVTPDIKKPEVAKTADVTKTGASDTTMTPGNTNKPEAPISKTA